MAHVSPLGGCPGGALHSGSAGNKGVGRTAQPPSRRLRNAARAGLWAVRAVGSVNGRPTAFVQEGDGLAGSLVYGSTQLGEAHRMGVRGSREARRGGR